MVSSARLFPKDPPPPGGFGPILDPRVIPQHMFDPVAPPLSADVTVVIGTTRDEAMLTLGGDDQFFRLDDTGLRTRVQRQGGAEAGTRIAFERAAQQEVVPAP